MDRYSFTLVVADLDTTNDDVVDRLYKASCNDALVAMSDARVILDFDRFALSYADAVNP